MNLPTLIAIKIERRAIAAAIFQSSHLEYTQVRHLPSNARKAEESAAAFINWLCLTFEVQSAALERVSQSSEIQRSVLTSCIINTLRANGASVWDVSKPDLFDACGLPAVKSRAEVREIMQMIWPILNGTGTNRWVLDAVALGLFVETERLFIS
jgi:hypothetical protein